MIITDVRSPQQLMSWVDIAVYNMISVPVMPSPKSPAVPMLVRLDADLKAELDRFREEEGISATWIVNKALREWVERYHEPLDRIKRHLAKGKRKARSS